jgi:NAD+ synthase (glutamine-hydrolysing)
LNLLRLGAAAVNQTPLDWEGNLHRINVVLEEAYAAEVGLLCLPELCLTGYGCEDMYFAPGVHLAALRSLVTLAEETRKYEGMAVAVGLPIYFESTLYNAAAVLREGEILGIACKQFLATDGIHYEGRWFKQWPMGHVAEIEIDGSPYSIGDLLFDFGGVKVGFEICRDAWVASRPGSRLAERGADIILNPSASHFAFGKQRVRERFVLEGSRAFGVSFVYCNLLGNEAGRAIFDGGTLIASGGQMVAAGPRLTFADHILTTAVVDIDASRRARGQSFDSLRDGNAGGATVECGVELAEVDGAPTPPLPCGVNAAGEWELSPQHKCEEFTRAEVLGLFDYLRKSGSKGFVVSLSGGADSAAVAVLVRTMLQLAAEELGEKESLTRLGGAALAKRGGKAMRELLTCVYQATNNSGEVTRSAAERIASTLGAEFLAWSVQPMVDAYTSTVSAAIDRELSWQADDVTLQNIQARARGPGVWMLANIKQALLLATSNRSEAAVGYATMDGDTCGGLAPLAGIDKAFLLTWFKWMETTGPHGLGPIPELSVITQQAPTAELRPSSARQTDESDLMPYVVLDAIERSAIRDKRLPVEVFRVIVGQFPEHSPQQLAAWVERFFKLWSRNQWKRERYAPSFHLDDENVDPRSWCRFPILSSGFESELADLREYAQMVSG